MHLLSATDLKQSFRRLARRPLLTATATLALTVAICLATVGFAVFQAALFAELPFEDGDRFVRFQVYGEDGSRGLDLDLYRLVALEAKSTAGLFDYVGAFGGDQFNLRHPSGEVEPVTGGLLTPDAFSRLPYTPLVGRTLGAADAAAGAAPVVLLREDLWQRRFERDPHIVGRRLEVAGVMRTVVGVLPQSAGFPAGGELWLPLGEDTLGKQNVVEAGALGLAILRSGATLAEAQVRFDVLVSRLNTERHADTEIRAVLTAYTEPPPRAKPMFTVLIGVLLLLLLVVAANLANLVLAQTSARAGELAVRSALGATRRRLVAEIFFEVLLQGAAAATIGLAVAAMIVERLDTMLDEKPFWIVFSVDGTTMAFVAVTTVLAAAVAGALPALRATRPAAGGSLRSGLHAAFGFGRVGATLTVSEMALSVGLLSGALVLAQGLATHDQQMLTFPHRQVLTARVILPETRAPQAGTPGLDAIADALDRVPGIVAHGASSQLPGLDAPLRPVRLLDESNPDRSEEPGAVPVVEVRDGFFASLGVEPTVGRAFRPADFEQDSPGVALVNQPFVDRYFRSGRALDRTLLWSATGSDDEDRVLRIVGVVPDLALSSAHADSAAGIYIPLGSDQRAVYLTLRADGDPTRLEQPVRRALVELDPNIQLRRVQPLARVGADERAFFAGLGTALLAMGAMAMLLSLVGTYATTSLTLSQRRREIGIRLALGAGSRQILTLVLGATGRYVAAGALLGGGFALLLLRVQDRLFVTRLPTAEPWILPMVIAAFAVAALGACWTPAQTALGIAPSEALRCD